MSRTPPNKYRATALLTLTGASAAAASLFAPARDHGVLDVVAVTTASGAYAYLTASIVLATPAERLTRWLGGKSVTARAERQAFIAGGVSGALYVVTIWFPIVRTLRRLDPHGPHVPTVPAAIVAAFGLGMLVLIRLAPNLRRRFARLIAPLTVTVFLAATVQFATAAKLLVTLTSPHGVYMIVVAGVGLTSLTRTFFTKLGTKR